jgi:hypothetical protein
MMSLIEYHAMCLPLYSGGLSFGQRIPEELPLAEVAAVISEATTTLREGETPEHSETAHSLVCHWE